MIWRCIATVLLAAMLVLPALASPAAAADWLTRLSTLREVFGSSTETRGATALEAATRHLKALPASEKAVALAAHASAEGHWSFVNRAGERYTAGTPDELKRVVGVLAPQNSAGDTELTVILTEDTVFNQRAALKDLPRRAHLMIGFQDEVYALVQLVTSAGVRLFAEVRPQLLVETADRRLFDEVAWQLARPLDRANIRVLALEPGGPQMLPASPKFDAQTKRALTDAIDPLRLPQALRAIARQTAVLSARIDGELMWFQPASGPQRSLVVKDLLAAAEAADVNLIVLQSATPRQPGARNWLWQTVAVDRLDAALQRAHLADFLNALGLGQGAMGATTGKLMITGSTTPSASGRTALRAVPVKSDGVTLTGLSEIFTDIVSDLAGRVVTTGVEANLIAADRQRELDRRLLPGLPASIQWLYLAGLLLGAVGSPLAWRWWDRIWPRETSDAYAGAIGLQLARAARIGLFAGLFMPAVALVTGPLTLAARGRQLLAWPWRAMRGPA